MINQPLARPMDADEYRAAIARLSLNQTGAARLLRVSARTSRHYADPAGAHPVPFAIAALLRLMLARNISPETIERLNAEGAQTSGFGIPRARNMIRRMTAEYTVTQRKLMSSGSPIFAPVGTQCATNQDQRKRSNNEQV